jgi:hypothetical protein
MNYAIRRCDHLRVLNKEVTSLLKEKVMRWPSTVLDLLIEIEEKSDWERMLQLRSGQCVNHTASLSRWATKRFAEIEQLFETKRRHMALAARQSQQGEDAQDIQDDATGEVIQVGTIANRAFGEQATWQNGPGYPSIGHHAVDGAGESVTITRKGNVIATGAEEGDDECKTTDTMVGTDPVDKIIVSQVFAKLRHPETLERYSIPPGAETKMVDWGDKKIRMLRDLDIMEKHHVSVQVETGGDSLRELEKDMQEGAQGGNHASQQKQRVDIGVPLTANQMERVGETHEAYKQSLTRALKGVEHGRDLLAQLMKAKDEKERTGASSGAPVVLDVEGAKQLDQMGNSFKERKFNWITQIEGVSPEKLQGPDSYADFQATEEVQEESSESEDLQSGQAPAFWSHHAPAPDLNQLGQQLQLPPEQRNLPWVSLQPNAVPNGNGNGHNGNGHGNGRGNGNGHGNGDSHHTAYVSANRSLENSKPEQEEMV